MGTEVTVDAFLMHLAARHRVMLLGGLAVIAHGFSRATKDADVWLEPKESPEAWADALRGSVGAFPAAALARLPQWEPISFDELPEAIEDVGMIRVTGLGSPIDVFRRPNELEMEAFDEVWNRGAMTDQGLKLPDALDLIVTKIDTGRDKDQQDISFLESRVRRNFGDRLEVATFAEAEALLDRYADYVVLGRGLKNPDASVRELVLRVLRDFAASGDPFCADILKERGESA